MNRNLLALAAVLAMQFTALGARAVCTAGNPNASVAESTPSSAFIDHGNGTLTHSVTGLMWKQCVQGTGGAGCASGTPALLTWSAALNAAVADATAGHSDWRLPNKKELESIVESCGYSPAINTTVFPATPESFFWSSSSYVPSPDYAWAVFFYVGNTYADDKTFDSYLRLVRGGRAFDAFDAQFPTTVDVTLDVDASITATKYDALTDGLLIIRYLFELTGPVLTTGALGGTATRTDPDLIKLHLDSIRPALDIDGNGTTDALTDGLLILRYLFELRGDALIAGAIGPQPSRGTSTAIEAYFPSLMP